MDKNTRKNVQTGLEIAVIGMAGRFPGAPNIDEFRDNLENGVESVTFYTEDNLRAAGIDPELLENPGYIRSGGGVLQDADCFDSSFFGYLPGEAEIMDPQSRIFHECAWEALEDAGYNPNAYNGAIGVYAGASNNPAWEISVLMSGKSKNIGDYNAATLANKEFLCLWVSYKLNLKGPAVEINTTCSTSLVAIHTACRALWTKECDIALAGGIGVKPSQASGYLYREGMIMSPDGHCRAFDAGAAGTIGGSGAGVVVLKKLKDAVNHGDNIHAVIKGTAINNDGIRKVGFTAPSIEGQADVIKTAQHISRVDPETIGYIETHGTGTPIGDPIEIEALTLAFNTTLKNYCALGSVKTNIGHLDTAAGVAGFIKTVLALKYRRIPPSLHFKTPNPKIDFQNSPFFVNTESREWKNNNGYPLRAGVSSFGIGGTNAHAVLEEWTENGRPKTEDAGYPLILLSGKTEAALERMTKNLAGRLKKTPGIDPADVAYTLAVGRDVFEYRKTVVCSGLNDAVHALESGDPDNVQLFQCKEKKRPVVFMFPGQGSQYVDMGRDLYNTQPLFREEMDRCFKLLGPLMEDNAGDILYPSRGEDNRSNGSYKTEKSYSEKINRTGITQPLIFAFEYALAKLLMSWGITPYAMIGHSIGEYAAACLSGVFSLADALKLTVLRGRLMQRMPPGAMLSVSLPEDQLKPLLDPGISLAALNSTSLSVISGTHEAVETCESRLKEMGHNTRRLHTSHAFHSDMMEPILPEFEENVKKIPLHKPAVPFISGVTGFWISNEKATAPGYWTGHLREPVNFRDGLNPLLEIKDALFIEVGPGNVLSAFLKQHKDKTAGHVAINMVRHPHENIPDHRYLSNKIGQLWLYGVNIDWEGYYSQEKRYRISLPTYPFERRRFLFTADSLLNGSKIKEWAPAAPPAQSGGEFTAKEPRVEEGVPSDSRPDLTRPYAAPGTRQEEKLVHLWQDFFGIQPIGIDDDFFELGGDSLKAATIMARVHQETGVVVPLAELFNHSTIRALSGYIGEAEKTGYEDIEAAEKKEYYPLSPAQNRLYILHGFGVRNTAYNLPGIFSLEGTIDKDALERNFKALIARHESLRTSFEIVSGEPVQRVNDHVEFKIDYSTPGNMKEAEDLRRFIRPFNLFEAPLMRVVLIKKEEGKYFLIMDMHHIVTDGTSLEISVRDFISFYSGRELPPLKLQYKDYSQWRQSPGVQHALAGQEEYWKKEFKYRIPLLNLPTDFPRPAVQRFEGNTAGFELNSEETKQLNQIAHTGGATLFMVILALYNIFLAKLCNREDIVVGTPTAGRGHAGLENIVGMFVNTVALYGRPSGEKSFERFLTEMKEKTLKAFENQDYPFETLVEKIAVKRDINRNPLFDTMFAMKNFVDVTGTDGIAAGKTGDLKIKVYPYEQRTSKIDLSLGVSEQDHKLYFLMEYGTALFKEETITRFIRYFKNIVSAVIREPGETISKFEILPEEEKRRLLFDFNDTETEYPEENKTIHRLIEEQAERTPNHIAVVDGSLQITYRELNERSHRSADLLNKNGVRAGTIVGIMVDPSVETIAGIMGIMKSGGAYLPIDPDDPPERINYILKDSNAAILLTKKPTIQITPPGKTMVLDFDPLNLECVSNVQSRTPDVDSSGLAYVVYTSGSTCKSRGGVLTQKNLVDHVSWFVRKTSLTAGDNGILTSSLAFDPGYTSVYPSLSAGGRLHIVPGATYRSAGKLLNYIAENRVSYLKTTPSLFNHIVNHPGFSKEKCRTLRLAVLGGEPINVQDIETLHRLAPHVEVMDLYGPTGAGICCVARFIDFNTLDDYKKTPTMGTPIRNMSVYILDNHLTPLPPGTAGELCVSGPNVAGGYLNRPDLTAEKFISNPYKPGETIYRTGDLARRRETGALEFLDCGDVPVEIRDFRMELGEIENRLLNCVHIDDAAVVTRDDKTGEKVLCAYYSSTKKVGVPELRRILAGALPGYMIPSHFIRVDKIPVTHGGKIDREALESRGFRTGTDDDYIPPQNEIEKKIAETWKDVLELEKVGVNENFFDLGGTSLDIIRLSVKIRDMFNEKEAAVQMFRYPTIRSFAEYLSRPGSEAAAHCGVSSPLPVNKIKLSRQNQKNKRMKGAISNDRCSV